MAGLPKCSGVEKLGVRAIIFSIQRADITVKSKLQDPNKGTMAPFATKKYRILLATQLTIIQISVCLFNVKVDSILLQLETLLDWMEIRRVSKTTSSERSRNKKRERSVKENRAHFVLKGDIGWFCLQLPLISDVVPEFCWICGTCLSKLSFPGQTA